MMWALSKSKRLFFLFQEDTKRATVCAVSFFYVNVHQTNEQSKFSLCNAVGSSTKQNSLANSPPLTQVGPQCIPQRTHVRRARTNQRKKKVQNQTWAESTQTKVNQLFIANEQRTNSRLHNAKVRFFDLPAAQKPCLPGLRWSLHPLLLLLVPLCPFSGSPLSRIIRLHVQECRGLIFGLLGGGEKFACLPGIRNIRAVGGVARIFVQSKRCHRPHRPRRPGPPGPELFWRGSFSV